MISKFKKRWKCYKWKRRLNSRLKTRKLRFLQWTIDCKTFLLFGAGHNPKSSSFCQFRRTGYMITFMPIEHDPPKEGDMNKFYCHICEEAHEGKYIKINKNGGLYWLTSKVTKLCKIFR